MAVRQVHPITLEGDHEKRIRQLEKQIARLVSPGQTYLSLFTDDDVTNLDPNDGAVWIGSEDNPPSFNYFIAGVTYQLFGN